MCGSFFFWLSEKTGNLRWTNCQSGSKKGIAANIAEKSRLRRVARDLQFLQHHLQPELNGMVQMGNRGIVGAFFGCPLPARVRVRDCLPGW